MDSKVNISQSDYSRLKEINESLDVISSERNKQRSVTGLYGAFAGALLALSIITFFTNIPNNNSDWTSNPNSPVYTITSEVEPTSNIKLALAIFGIFASLGTFIVVRNRYASDSLLNEKRWTLVNEMRALRDKMYLQDQVIHEHRTAHPAGSPDLHLPLSPDEIRGEYLGVYSPPGSHGKAAPPEEQ